MTSTFVPDVRHPLSGAAVAAAEEAARTGGVRVGELHELSELEPLCLLLRLPRMAAHDLPRP